MSDLGPPGVDDAWPSDEHQSASSRQKAKAPTREPQRESQRIVPPPPPTEEERARRATAHARRLAAALASANESSGAHGSSVPGSRKRERNVTVLKCAKVSMGGARGGLVNAALAKRASTNWPERSAHRWGQLRPQAGSTDEENPAHMQQSRTHNYNHLSASPVSDPQPRHPQELAAPLCVRQQSPAAATVHAIEDFLTDSDIENLDDRLAPVAATTPAPLATADPYIPCVERQALPPAIPCRSREAIRTSSEQQSDGSHSTGSLRQPSPRCSSVHPPLVLTTKRCARPCPSSSDSDPCAGAGAATTMVRPKRQRRRPVTEFPSPSLSHEPQGERPAPPRRQWRSWRSPAHTSPQRRASRHTSRNPWYGRGSHQRPSRSSLPRQRDLRELKPQSPARPRRRSCSLGSSVLSTASSRSPRRSLSASFSRSRSLDGSRSPPSRQEQGLRESWRRRRCITALRRPSGDLRHAASLRRDRSVSPHAGLHRQSPHRRRSASFEPLRRRAGSQCPNTPLFSKSTSRTSSDLSSLSQSRSQSRPRLIRDDSPPACRSTPPRTLPALVPRGRGAVGMRADRGWRQLSPRAPLHGGRSCTPSDLLVRPRRWAQAESPKQPPTSKGADTHLCSSSPGQRNGWQSASPEPKAGNERFVDQLHATRQLDTAQQVLPIDRSPFKTKAMARAKTTTPQSMLDTVRPCWPACVHLTAGSLNYRHG
jgi:hypothetical protein